MAALFPLTRKNDSKSGLFQKKLFCSNWYIGHVEYKVVNPGELFLTTWKKTLLINRKIYGKKILTVLFWKPSDAFMTIRLESFREKPEIFSYRFEKLSKKLQTNR